MNETRRPHWDVALRADARVRQARGEPHLHVVRPAKDAGTENARPNYSSPFAYSVPIGDIDDAINIDLAESFRQAGVDIAGLLSISDHGDQGRLYEGGHNEVTSENAEGHKKTMSKSDFIAKRQSFLGQFQNGYAIVSGEISYRSQAPSEANHRHMVRFFTIVYLYNEYAVGVGAPAPPSFQYGTRLEVEGRDYTRRINISHEIKPGATDRFEIKVGVEKSSIHKFNLKLVANGSQIINGSEIALRIFVPRSGAQYMRQAANGPAPSCEPGAWDNLQLRLEMEFLNSLPALLRADLSEADQRTVRVRIERSKLVIMRDVWEPGWGRFEDFRRWIDDGAPDPIPPSLSEAAAYYRQRSEIQP